LDPTPTRPAHPNPNPDPNPNPNPNNNPNPNPHPHPHPDPNNDPNANPSPSQAGDTRQETTALQNMGTSLVMMGQLYEAARCYVRAFHLAALPLPLTLPLTLALAPAPTPNQVRAFHLASAAEDPAAQVELLESLG